MPDSLEERLKNLADKLRLKHQLECGLELKPSPRAKSYILKLTSPDRLRLSLPPGYSARTLDEVIGARTGWIAETRARLQRREREARLAQGGFPPAELKLSGIGLRFEVLFLEKPSPPRLTQRAPAELLLTGPSADEPALAGVLVKFVRDKAGPGLRQRLGELSQATGLVYSQTSLRAQRSRFGSCNAKGAISLNYRLAFLPRELCDYVLVHELCHLRELNHSKNYWNLICSILPKARELDRGLRQAHEFIPFWAR